MSGVGGLRARNRGRGGGRRNRGNHSRDYRSQGGPDNASDTIVSLGGGYNAHLSERFRGGQNGKGGQDSRILKAPSSVLNPHIAQYIHDADNIPEDVEDWLKLSEVPSADEVCVADDFQAVLPANRIDKPWKSKERYLKSHYRLLREDCVSPLREALLKFRKDPYRMDDHDMRIYVQVRIVGLTFNSKNVAFRIRFSTERANKRIVWSQSKRLTSGTLVALTPTQDEFKTECMLAIVAARPLNNLEANPPEIDLFFGRADDCDLNPQITYTMVEASQGYFEAYRHTLRALQKQCREPFPLHEQICHLKESNTLPEHIQRSPIYDFSAAAPENQDVEDTLLQVDLTKTWPQADNTTLDQSQWEALRNILTQKLSIIQGPPGTGKTHVSKIAIEILLKNRSVNQPPIVIACQTNHALDQLLEKINDFEKNFVRLGGRSTSKDVKQRALHEVRKGEVMENVRGSIFQKARRDLDTSTMKLKSILSVWKDDGTSAPVSAEAMFRADVIDQAQFDSLEKGAKKWVTSDGEDQEPMQMWLGKSAMPFVAHYGDDNFGFEEVEADLEIEQLRDLEAIDGVNDEEDAELLAGDWFPLSFGFVSSSSSPDQLKKANEHFKNSRDMYKIPASYRSAVYALMQKRLLSQLRSALRTGVKEYRRLCSELQIGRWERDIAYLERAPIIGMTTTGLSKYRALVSSLKPEIILIEEAAEVLEGPISVACVPSLQHLILVGDHQQLQASCSVRALKGEPHYLNVSMFERLFNNKMPRRTLLKQRRMDPDFRLLFAPAYPGLEDHPDVIDRPIEPWGMGEVRSWFFNHPWYELQDEQMSTYNENEALFVAKFYRHLIRNGVPAAAVTVLTFYNGQRKKILRFLKDDPETASIYNKVKTVDSYQGEENIIVLLSLVRKNESGKIGFLDINNRVIVALSRAKYGFYIFGSGQFLADRNEIWQHVDAVMKAMGRSSYKLPLTCVNHGNTVMVEHAEQFDVLSGGCLLHCDGELKCGHKCPKRCHTWPHSRLICHLPCTKILACGHQCGVKCSQPCSCDCEIFQQQQREQQVLQGDSVDTWQKLTNKSKEMTEDNLNEPAQASSRQIPARILEDESDDEAITVQAQQDSVLPLPRRMENGRTRYQELYSATQDDGFEDTDTNVLADRIKNLKADMSQSSVELMDCGRVTRADTWNGPTRQSHGLPQNTSSAWGLDGASDQKDDMEHNGGYNPPAVNDHNDWTNATGESQSKGKSIERPRSTWNAHKHKVGGADSDVWTTEKSIDDPRSVLGTEGGTIVDNDDDIWKTEEDKEWYLHYKQQMETDDNFW